MKRLTLSLALSGLIISPLSLADENLDGKLATYRSTMKELGGGLLTELSAALKEGGPNKAIEVCHTKAPQAAAKVADKTGFKVGRTSLKPRNPQNAPDAWEEGVLKKFEERKAAGENPQNLEYHEVIEKEGQRQVRYMKAIPTLELCVACHGTNIAPNIQAKLKELYPQDKATGFQVGDLRGAFTLTETLPAKPKE